MNVFICSPLRGDFEGNQQKAKAYARDAALEGHLPIVPHIYFTQFLHEQVEEERKLGIHLGIKLLEICDELWVYGEPSMGMRQEIDHWQYYFPEKPIRRKEATP